MDKMHHDVYMRTTLTLDDDVATQLTELAHRERKPFRAVVNETLRKGLGTSPAIQPKPFKVTPFKLGLRPGIDPDRLNQFVDELEVEYAIEKMKKGR